MWRFLRSWRLRRLARRNPYRPPGPAYQGPFGPAFFSGLNMHGRTAVENQRLRRRRRKRQVRIIIIAVVLVALGWMLSESLRGLRLF